MSGPFFHGGVRGLRRGGVILPPRITGVPSNADYGAEGVCRRDRVYLVDELDQARIFAILAPPVGHGDVYEVEPLGEQEPDPDYSGPGECLQAELAKVVRVVERRVQTVQGLSMEEVLAAVTPDGDSYTSAERFSAVQG